LEVKKRALSVGSQKAKLDALSVEMALYKIGKSGFWPIGSDFWTTNEDITLDDLKSYWRDYHNLCLFMGRRL
jgi:hypothetical protein